jgi:hypothetical protein
MLFKPEERSKNLKVQYIPIELFITRDPITYGPFVDYMMQGGLTPVEIGDSLCFLGLFTAVPKLLYLIGGDLR